MIRIATNRQMRKISNKYTKQIFDFCCVKTEKEFYKIELKHEVKNNNSSKIHYNKIVLFEKNRLLTS